MNFEGVIVGIDPGSKCVGWSMVATYGQQLLNCGVVRGKTPTEVHEEGAGISAFLRSRCGTIPVLVVIECPQVYPKRTHWKGPPNDLIRIALVGGMVVGSMSFTEVEVIRPHDWKGSVPKEVMLGRIQKRLTSVEMQHVLNVDPPSLRHNAIDAVGIALWKAGRL